MAKVQFWLASLDRYGNAKLIDGAHDDRAGVEKAAALFDALGFRKDLTLACAEVHVTELTGQHEPLNAEAIDALRMAATPRHGGRE